MAEALNKQCTITNNSGKDIVVTLAIPRDEIVNNGAAIGANGELEVLHTLDGNAVIKNNNSGTLTLDHNYKPGSKQSGYVKNYELVAADTNWLYPLGMLNAVQTGENGSTAFPALTIDNTSAAAIAQAAKFYQAISAYPESQLITDYTSALEATKAATTAEEIAATMNGFFKGTTDYKEVTLAAVSAVHEYYNNFPAVWTHFQDQACYYLYGSDGDAASFVGTINLKKSAAMDPLMPAGGYTCTFNPATNPADTSAWAVDTAKQLTLNYAVGMFVSEKTTGQASIALKGNFLLKSFFSNKQTDDSILLVLTGNVNGTVCVGFDKPQAAPKPTAITPTAVGSAEEFWDLLIHPRSQLEIGISLVFFCGAVALLGGIVRAVYAVYKSASATNSTPNLSDAMNEQISNANGRVKTLAGGNAPEQKPYIIKDWQHAARISKDTLRKGQIVEAFERQKWAARAMLQKSPEVLGSDAVSALEQCLTDGRTATEKLNKASLDDLRKVIDTEYTKLSIVQGQLATLAKHTQNELSESGRGLVSDNLALSNDIIQGVGDAISEENKEELESDFVFVDDHPY